MRYTALLRWSRALRAAVVAETLWLVSFYLLRETQFQLTVLFTMLATNIFLVLALFTAISLGSAKGTLRGIGWGIYGWSFYGLAFILDKYVTLSSHIDPSIVLDSLVISFSLIVIPPIVSRLGRRSAPVVAGVLYVILLLPSTIYLVLGPVTALQLFHFISMGKIASLSTLRAELTPFGRPMLLTQLAVLTEFVLFSYKGSMAYTSIRSVGLTFLFPPLLGLGVLYLFDSENVVSYLLAGLSFLPLLVSFLEKRPLQLGLLVSSVALAVGATLFQLTPIYVLPLTVSAGLVVPRGLQDPNRAKVRLGQAIDSGDTMSAKSYVSFLRGMGVSVEELICESISKGNCGRTFWYLRNYKADFSKCSDLKGLADCMVSKGVVPPQVVEYLNELKKRDPETLEKAAGVVLQKGERTERETAKRILFGEPVKTEAVKLPPLSSWDPSIWVGRELYGYKISRVIGRGGTSYVLYGEKGGERAAVKIPTITPGEGTKFAFLDLQGESSALKEISERSEDIVKLYGIFADRIGIKEVLSGKTENYLNYPPAVVMEYMGGGDAEELLKMEAVLNSEKWQAIVAFIGLKVARALSAVHAQGYVHLDVKTRNVFFSSSPGRTGGEVLNNLMTGKVKVKLGDLGAAKRVGTSFDQYTAEYAPVEQVRAILLGGGADPKMDIFAFGATIYKMLKGVPLNPPEVIKATDMAFRGDRTYLEVANNAYRRFYATLQITGDPQLISLVRAALNPEPSQRPSAKSIASDLERLLGKLT